MSSVVHIDPVGRREMDRDYLDPTHGRPARVAKVVNFTSRLERGICVACGQVGHRSSRCPNKQQS